MTLAEIDAAFAGRAVIRHHGACFVHSRDVDEAAAWRERGAQVRPVDAAPAYLAEIHLAGLLDFVPEPDPDDPDVIHDGRPRVLLAHYRERDGFTWPAREEW